MRVVRQYAQAMDNVEPEILRLILTEDVEIVGPGFSISGIDSACAIPADLREKFSLTRHVVHNQIVSGSGTERHGEVHCTASHLLPPGDGNQGKARDLLVWEIRYQDSYRYADNAWRISRRELTLDWVETRSVEV